MKASRIFSLVFGVALVCIGMVSMGGNLLLQTESWRLWPMTVIIAGLLLTIPGFFGLTNRGLGALFIPGIPVLVTGGILMVASISQHWNIWALAWPMEVLAVAFGFGLAAVFMRVPALVIPSLIVGVNGIVLAFCNLTGLWQAWALLWPVEPLAVGLGLLILGLARRSGSISFAGVILCALAGVGFFMMSFMSMFNLSILRFTVPAMLMLTGVIIALMSFVRRDAPVKADVETTNA